MCYGDATLIYLKCCCHFALVCNGAANLTLVCNGATTLFLFVMVMPIYICVNGTATLL